MKHVPQITHCTICDSFRHTTQHHVNVTEIREVRDDRTTEAKLADGICRTCQNALECKVHRRATTEEQAYSCYR